MSWALADWLTLRWRRGWCWSSGWFGSKVIFQINVFAFFERFKSYPFSLLASYPWLLFGKHFFPHYFSFFCTSFFVSVAHFPSSNSYPPSVHSFPPRVPQHTIGRFATSAAQVCGE